jgi:hypothetical protein
MNADGTGKVRLTSDYGVATDREPSWNPLGTLIAFTRAVPTRGTSEIFVVRADGVGKRPVARTRPGAYDASPSWSPAGKSIAYASDRAGGFPEIWVINADGTGRRRLTTNNLVDANPAWSPDGSRIAFERCCVGGNSDVYVINADGTGLVRVTATPQNETDPTWAPDGSTIAFTVFPPGGGNRDVHSVNLDGTGERMLTDGAPADVAPDWYGEPIQPSPEPTPSPTEEPTPTPTEEPTPTPTEEPTPSPDPGGSGGASVGFIRANHSSGLRMPAAGRPRYRTVESRQVLPGLRYRKFVDRRGPNRIYVLQMDAMMRPTLDVALAGGDLPGLARTSRMAAEHHAVAAVNGDFGLPGGRPAHPFAEDGHLHQTSFAYSHNVAVTHRKDAAYFRHPTARLSLLQTASGDVLRVDRWNRGEPTWGEVAAYTPSGGTLEMAPTFACSARLQPSGPRRWADAELGVSRDYVVDDAACRRIHMSRQGGIVVSAQPGSPEATLIRSLVPGETVTLTWSFGWAGVADSIGGYPLLVQDGAVVVTGCRASFCARHPRTAIGVDDAGRMLLVVVDGRRKGSVGMTLHELARLMRKLGTVDALNLDGGGSTTMVVRRKIVNEPSSGWERSVSSAVLILDGVDPKERIAGAVPLSVAGESGLPEKRGGYPEPYGAGVGRGSPEVRALLDPASTGGMLDAMDRGLFGARRNAFPSDLRRLLRTFRSST